MRGIGAAVLGVIAAIVIALCIKGVVPAMVGVVAAMTLAFAGAWAGILGATEDAVTPGQKRFAIWATVGAVIVLFVASALFLKNLGG